MAMSGEHHLDADQLAALAAGRLSEADLADVEVHLAACPACCAAAAALPEDPLPRDLRQAWSAYRKNAPDAPATPLKQAAAESAPDRTVPMRLGGYRLVREVGRGGMGVVYEAVEEALGRHVALKMLPAHAQQDPRYLLRFQREARAAGRLLHRNIVPVYGVGEHEGINYYVMQFIAGKGLDCVLAELRRTPREATAPGWMGPDAGRAYFTQIARVGMQVAEALAYAHGQGVLHRDVKPSNLLLDGQGSVWVSDFGLAKASDGEDNLTHSGDLIGTLRYMAPERFRGHSDARSDIYALGLTLYELLTLRPAFGEGDQGKLVHQVLHDEPPRARAVNPAVPQDLDTIVTRAIAREPERRYPSAAALADDLQRWLEDRPIRARPASRLEHAWRWARRNRTLAGLLAAVVGILLAGTSLVTWKWRDEARAHAEADRAQAVSDQFASAALAEKTHAEESRREAERLTASTALDLAISLGENGQVDRGLVLLARGLELAVRSGNAELEQAFRRNLTAWRAADFRKRGRFFVNDWITDLAYSPDGRRFAVASRGKFVQVGDTATGQPLGQPLAHDAPVSTLAFSPDGKQLLTGTGDSPLKGEARLWDLATGKPLGPPLVRDGYVSRVAFRPDGRSLLIVAKAQARLWRSDRKSDPVLLPHRPGVSSAGYSPDGRFVVTAGPDGTVRLWDAADGKPVSQVLRHDTRGIQFPDQVCLVRAVAFSPDSKLLVTGSFVTDLSHHRYLGGEARLWRVPDGEPVGVPLPSLGPVMAAAFSPDSRRLLTSHLVVNPPKADPKSGWAQLWDVATGRAVGAPLRTTGPMWSVAFSPDGRGILTGSETGLSQFWIAATGLPLGPAFWGTANARSVAFAPDGQTALVGHTHDQSEVELWEAPRASATDFTARHDQAITTLAVSPDSQLLLTGSDDQTARLWNASTGTFRGPAWRHPRPVTSVAFSPDGRLALTGSADGTAQLWDVATGQAHGPRWQHTGRVAQVTFSRDGRLAVTAAWDGTVRFWDVATGRPHSPLLREKNAVAALAIRPDGRLVLTGSNEHGPLLWEVAGGQSRRLGPDSWAQVGYVAFSPDGRWCLAGSLDGTTRLWDTTTGVADGPVLRHGSAVRSACFSPDGTRVLTTSNDRTAVLWDPATGQSLTPPLQHPDKVLLGTFSPDGSLLATVCDDRAVRLWDVRTGRRIGPALHHPAEVTAVIFRPDGSQLICAGADGMLRLWDVPAPTRGEPRWLREAAEGLTGIALDDRGVMQALDEGVMAQRRRELQRRGDPFQAQ
jgi:WD40 repeat protein